MQINSIIAPFHIYESEGLWNFLYDAGSIHREIFAELYDDGGPEGNGYTWTALALTFIRQNFPELEKDLHIDSEETTCLLDTANREILEAFALAFKKLCDDEAAFRKLIAETDFSDWE